MSAEIVASLHMQQQQVLRQFDEFSRLLLAPEQRKAALESLMGVIVDVGMHFGYQESLMETDAYADFAHHRRQHMGIMTELGLLADRLERNQGAAELARGADFLLHWLQQHIASSDGALESWLQSRA